MSATDIGRSYPSRDFLRSQVCLLTLFENSRENFRIYSITQGPAYLPSLMNLVEYKRNDHSYNYYYCAGTESYTKYFNTCNDTKETNVSACRSVVSSKLKSVARTLKKLRTSKGDYLIKQ